MIERHKGSHRAVLVADCRCVKADQANVGGVDRIAFFDPWKWQVDMVLSTGGVERVWNNDTSIPYLRAMYVIENAQLVRAEGSVQLEAHAAEMFRIGIGDRLSEYPIGTTSFVGERAKSRLICDLPFRTSSESQRLT